MIIGSGLPYGLRDFEKFRPSPYIGSETWRNFELHPCTFIGSGTRKGEAASEARCKSSYLSPYVKLLGLGKVLSSGT